jgi:hypothetical protein
MSWLPPADTLDGIAELRLCLYPHMQGLAVRLCICYSPNSPGKRVSEHKAWQLMRCIQAGLHRYSSVQWMEHGLSPLLDGPGQRVEGLAVLQERWLLGTVGAGSGGAAAVVGDGGEEEEAMLFGAHRSAASLLMGQKEQEGQAENDEERAVCIYVHSDAASAAPQTAAEALAVHVPMISRALLASNLHDDTTDDAAGIELRRKVQRLLLHRLGQHAHPIGAGHGEAVMVTRTVLKSSAEQLLLQYASLAQSSPSHSAHGSGHPLLLPLLSKRSSNQSSSCTSSLHSFGLRFLCSVCAQPTHKTHRLQVLDRQCHEALLYACSHSLLVLKALLQCQLQGASFPQLLELAGGAQDSLELLLEQHSNANITKECVQLVQSMLLRALQQRLLQSISKQPSQQPLGGLQPARYVSPVLVQSGQHDLYMKRVCNMLQDVSDSVLMQRNVSLVEGRAVWVCAGQDGKPSTCQELLASRGSDCLIYKLQQT